MVRRILLGLVTIWAVSVVSYAIISLPPGDYVSAYIAQLKLSGEPVSEEEAANLRQRYGLGQPIYVQYLKWASQAARGNFGVSMQWGRPVMETIGDRLWLTVALAFFAVMLTWMLAIPVGIYLCGQAVLDSRLLLYVHRVCRLGHSQLPAGPGAHVPGLRLVRRQHRRTLLR